MSDIKYFALVNNENVVEQVIVASNDFVSTLNGNWIETSIDGSFRANYAGAGFTYDKDRDVFVPPLQWEAPSE